MRETIKTTRGRPLNRIEQQPRVPLSRIAWANIRKFQYMMGMSEERLAKLLNVTTRTLKNWDETPERIQLKFIDDFCVGTNIDISEILER